MRVWIVNHHGAVAAYLASRSFLLAGKLAELGHDVTLITGSYCNDSYRYLREENLLVERTAGHRVVWIRPRPAYRGSGLARVINMFDFVAKLYLHHGKFVREFGNPDAVIASSPQPFVWLAANRYARRAGGKWICEVRDLWPETIVDLTGRSRRHPFITLVGWLERWAYRRADKVVTTLPYADRYVCDVCGVPRERWDTVTNGVDFETAEKMLAAESDEFPDTLSRLLDTHFCCVYAGNMSYTDSVDMMLDAARIVGADHPDIQFLFIGGGANLPEFQRMGEGMGNVHFFGNLPYATTLRACQRARACLAGMRSHKVFRYGISKSKLNAYLYAGTPVIFAFDYESPVSESGGGICTPSDDVSAFAKAILELYSMPPERRAGMGDRGREYVKKHHDWNMLAKKYDAILKSL